MLVLPAVIALGALLVLARVASMTSESPGAERCFGEADRRRPPTALERTFLFADLVGFTALVEAEGDWAGARAADRLRWAARRALRGDAALVKTLGDGVMVVAGTPAAAAATAFSLVDLVDAEPGVPPVAVGLHRGVAVEVGGDYFGSAVNLAARLVDEAGAGQILCTASVAEAVTDAAVTVPIGVASFKGVPEPVGLYELRDRASVGGER